MLEEGDAALEEKTPKTKRKSGEDSPMTRRTGVELRQRVKSRQGVKVHLIVFLD